MSNFHKVSCLALVVLFTTGCASTVNRNTASIKEEKVQIQSTQGISKVTLALNSKAKEKLSDNSNFSSDALLKKINSTLQSNHYLKPGINTNTTVEITVTNIRVRSGVSAIMLGFLAGADYITGDIAIKEGGRLIDKFEVDVNYAFGGAMGDTDTRMNWMYESFANKMTEEVKRLIPLAKN